MVLKIFFYQPVNRIPANAISVLSWCRLALPFSLVKPPCLVTHTPHGDGWKLHFASFNIFDYFNPDLFSLTTVLVYFKYLFVLSSSAVPVNFFWRNQWPHILTYGVWKPTAVASMCLSASAMASSRRCLRAFFLWWNHMNSICFPWNHG